MEQVGQTVTWFDGALAEDIHRIAVEEKAVRRLATRLVRAGSERNLTQLRGQYMEWSGRLAKLAELLGDARVRLEGFRIPVDDPEVVHAYTSALQQAVERGGVRLEGEFPRFNAFPIEVRLDLGQEQVFVNRRRLHVLDPQALAAVIVREHRRAHGAAFNADRFMRTLASAYDLLVAAQPARTIGAQQVSLRSVHDLLVLRTGPAAYSLTEFAFDIYRLRTTTELTYGGRRFYFGYTRKQGGTVPVPTSAGNYENLAVLELRPIGGTEGG